MPAFRHAQIPETASVNRENNKSHADEGQTMAARGQLVRTLMQENESLKATIEKWAPAVSAYRKYHSLVQGKFDRNILYL